MVLLRAMFFAKEDADALLSLGEEACIEGDIHVPNIVVNGRVVGNIYCKKSITLSDSSVIDGNVHYKKIEVMAGSEINGRFISKTTNAKKSDNDDSKLEQKPVKKSHLENVLDLKQSNSG